MLVLRDHLGVESRPLPIKRARTSEGTGIETVPQPALSLLLALVSLLVDPFWFLVFV